MLTLAFAAAAVVERLSSACRTPPLPTHVRVGSRKSELALTQTRTIIAALQAHFPTIKFEIVAMSTTGDNVLDRALSKIGEKSLFTKELEVALAKREVDFVVHSLKDLPTTLPDGMAIGAIYRRDSPYDVVVMSEANNGRTLAELPAGSVVGTSSLRRVAQLKRAYPALQYKDIRGNINTRLRKLDEGLYDAIVLASAGLDRMGWQDRISETLDPDVSLHAVGQGAMAVECRADDRAILRLLMPLHDTATAICCVAERAFMRSLEGGCSVPLGVHTRIRESRAGAQPRQGSRSRDVTRGENGRFELDIAGGVFALDGSEAVRLSLRGIVADEADAEAVGVQLADELRALGATRVLEEARRTHAAQ